jgi:hypothetical protein
VPPVVVLPAVPPAAVPPRAVMPAFPPPAAVPPRAVMPAFPPPAAVPPVVPPRAVMPAFRPPAAGPTLLPSVDVQIRPGMGNGAQHAFARSFTGRPFPFAKTAVATFDVMFKSGFEWGCRGKLGGLFVGSGAASGGRHTDGAASMRVCWNKNGGAFTYVYVPDGTQNAQPFRPNGTFGVSLWEREFASVFRYDTWHRIELGMVLNTPGQRDGSMYMAIDGVRQTMTGITWRKAAQPVSLFKLGIFHGGPCRATKNSALSVRNLSVSGS